ncbi:MAG: hypothetical protein FWC47_08570 [Oscillospiraceae bacterium]|nr:hypothetical protein [Oscillospiraceae bacterium]
MILELEILFYYLLITILVEGIAIFIIFRHLKYIYYSLLCNILTNPALNLLLLYSNRFGPEAYYLTFLFGEIAVVFIEAYVYNYICRFGFKKSIILSFVLNVLSCGVGFLVNML